MAVAVRLFFEGERLGPKFQRGTIRQRDAVLSSVRTATSQVTEDGLTKARQQISQAGNFGQRWTSGLRATQTEGGGSIRVAVTHDIPYFMVHQRGATIRGKPLLWIPLSFARDALGVRARDYPGSLFRVDRAGKSPLLMTSTGSGEAEAKYSGHASVKIPKRFRTLEILRESFLRLNEFYAKELAKK